MGRLILVKCDCGFIKADYRYGFTSGYDEVQKHLMALVKSGHYGIVWKELLLSDSDFKVDTSIKLYQCTNCNQLFDEYCLDIYKHSKTSYAPVDGEVIHFYKHLCPVCKKRMTLIPLSQKSFGYGTDNPEELVICPKCGDTAIAELCGYTD